MKQFLAAATLAVLAGCGSPVAFGDPGPNTNDVAYWCPNGGEKFEPVADPYIVPAGNWSLLVIKGGSGPDENFVVTNPVVGQGYSHPTAGNSHVILCYPAPTTTTTAAPPTTTTTTTLPVTTTTGVPTTTTTSLPPTTTTTTTTPPTTTTTTSPTTTTTSPPTTTTTTAAPTTTTTLPTGGLFSFPAVSAQCTSTGNAIIAITFPARPDLEGQVGTLVMQTSIGQTFTQPLTFLSGASVTIPYPAGILSSLSLTYTLGTEVATAVVAFPTGCAPTTTTTTLPGATTTTVPGATTTVPGATTTTPTGNTFTVTPTTLAPTTTRPVLTGLPETGSSTLPMVLIASAFVLAGGVLMATRRKA